MHNKPHTQVVGITGGIGSGKSLVCSILKAMGYPIYSADERGKWLMEQDAQLIQSIKHAFGPEAYSNDVLNRSFLAKRVFTNSDELNTLKNLVHPAVALDFKNWIQDQSSPIAFKESALLFENNLQKDLCATILVTAPESIRIERVLKRDSHRTKDDILRIIEKQLPESEKQLLATHIIKNDGSTAILPQLKKILDDINSMVSK